MPASLHPRSSTLPSTSTYTSRAPYSSSSDPYAVSSSLRSKLACTFCRKRKVRCDGQGARCSNCSRSKRNCTYAIVPDDVNRATKDRKERLAMLKSLGFVVPRGGAATKAEREGRLPSLQLSSVKSVAEPTPVKASAVPRPFPSVLKRPDPSSADGEWTGGEFPPSCFTPLHPPPAVDDPRFSSTWDSEPTYFSGATASHPFSSSPHSSSSVPLLVSSAAALVLPPSSHYTSYPHPTTTSYLINPEPTSYDSFGSAVDPSRVCRFKASDLHLPYPTPSEETPPTHSHISSDAHSYICPSPTISSQRMERTSARYLPIWGDDQPFEPTLSQPPPADVPHLVYPHSSTAYSTPDLPYSESQLSRSPFTPHLPSDPSFHTSHHSLHYPSSQHPTFPPPHHIDFFPISDDDDDDFIESSHSQSHDQPVQFKSLGLGGFSSNDNAKLKHLSFPSNRPTIYAGPLESEPLLLDGWGSVGGGPCERFC